VSIVVRFNPKNVTREMYDEVARRLEEAGQWPDAPGLEFHVLYGEEGSLRVSEIWDSSASLQAYGEIIGPIMAEVGVEMASEPEIYEVQNIVKR
jgi:hypothetical protein